MSDTVKEHYVPQFYLKNFMDDRGLLHVYDFEQTKIFYPKPKNICCENNLYETKWENANVNLDDFVLRNNIENIFSKYEREYSKVLQKILQICNKLKNSNTPILCRNEEDIQNVTDEIIDRYGQIPNEIENLLDIVRIKGLAKENYILKINQKMENIIFHFDQTKFNFEIVDKLMKIYRNRIKFSPAKDPYITFKLTNKKNTLEECKEFLSRLK